MKWMWRHKSLGVLTGIVVAPRLGYRLFNLAKVSCSQLIIGEETVQVKVENSFEWENPQEAHYCSKAFYGFFLHLIFPFCFQQYKIEHLPGHGPVLNIAASASHLALYGFMTIMPATGIAMGMYGGKGLPFFWTTIPGFEQKNGKLAGQVSSEIANNFLCVKGCDSCIVRMLLCIDS